MIKTHVIKYSVLSLLFCLNMAAGGWVLLGLVIFLGAGLAITSVGFSGAYITRENAATSPTPTPVTPSETPSPEAPAPEPVPTPSSPTPVPPGLWGAPPVAPAGLLCTSSQAGWANVNTSCFENPPVSPLTTYCQGMRNITDWACFRDACTWPIEREIGGDIFYLELGELWTSQPTEYTWTAVANLDPTDGGPARVPVLLQKFIADNADGPVQPLDSLNDTLIFTSDDYLANVSFSTNGQQMMAALAAAQWNTGVLQNPGGATYNPTEANWDYAVGVAYGYLVMTPAHCPDTNFSSIGWLQNNNVTWQDFIATVLWFTNLNMSNSNVSAPENWDEQCLYWTEEEWFCDLWISGYYSYESLTDMGVRPNMLEDLTVIFNALNLEFNECGEPRGCFGIVPPPPETFAQTTSYCTFTVNMLDALDDSCFPVPADNYSLSYCQDFRFAPDWPCFIAGCTLLLAQWDDPAVSFTVGRVTLLTNDSFPDGGPVHLIQLMQQFLADNNISNVTARPMNATQVWTQDNYGVDSFETSGTQFARWVLQALYSRQVMLTLSRNSTARYPDTLAHIVEVYNMFVYSPSFLCEDEGLLAIPWVRDFDVLLTDAIMAANAMLGADLTQPEFQPENWLVACPSVTGLPIFCDQFAGGDDAYYAMASLYNFSMTPSPYTDLETLMRVYIESISGCTGETFCLGVPAIYPIIAP
jgi:hypothetical protein